MFKSAQLTLGLSVQETARFAGAPLSFSPELVWTYPFALGTDGGQADVVGCLEGAVTGAVTLDLRAAVAPFTEDWLAHFTQVKVLVLENQGDVDLTLTVGNWTTGFLSSGGLVVTPNDAAYAVNGAGWSVTSSHYSVTLTPASGSCAYRIWLVGN